MKIAGPWIFIGGYWTRLSPRDGQLLPTYHIDPIFYSVFRIKTLMKDINDKLIANEYILIDDQNQFEKYLSLL